jgi:glycosyltransferase involved in cell wall biosynthesis
MAEYPLISICCCTFLRPHLLPRVLRCFLGQDYRGPKELVILDDAGQYVSRKEESWQIISIDRRFRTLGEKRNACAALARSDSKYLCQWDDDDLYEPHALSAVAAALKRGDFAWPSKAIDIDAQGNRTIRTSNNPLHPSWGYTREIFDKLGGYAPLNLGEDCDYWKRARVDCVSIDPLQLGFEPYFILCHETSTYHLSQNMLNARYQDIEESETYRRREKGITLTC